MLGLVCDKLNQKEEAQNYYRMATAGAEEVAGVMYYNDQPADMILFQGLAWEKLGETAKAKAKYAKLIDYGERHIDDPVKIEYFAVSLPDFLIFDEDLNMKNKAHCYYLLGLGNLGYGRKQEAERYFTKALQYEKYHQKALYYREKSEK